MSECQPSSCGDVHCGNLSQYPVLQDCLPPGYDYHVVAFEEQSSETDNGAFCATLRLPLKTEQETTQWILETKDTPALVTWRVYAGRRAKGMRNLYRKDYRCQHNVSSQWKLEDTKNTNCPAKLSVIIKADPRREGNTRAKVDLHLPQYPTVVILKNIHNHNVHSTFALKYRDVGNKAQEELIRLFEMGHSAAAGLAVFRNDLQAKLGDNYVHASADRALCPDRDYTQGLRYKHFGKYRRESSLPGSQKKRKKKKKACPDAKQCVTADEEQTDNLMQSQSSQQNPSQGDIGTNQEECEAESAADFLCLSEPSDYEEDTEDLVETMIRDLSSLRKDLMYTQAIAAMAKQFHHIRSNRSRLLSAMHCFGKGQTSSIRTATRQPDAPSPCQPTVSPRPVTKLISKRPSGPQQTHSSPIKRPRMMDYHI